MKIMLMKVKQVRHMDTKPAAPVRSEEPLSRLSAEGEQAQRSIDGKFGFKDGKIINLVSGQEIPEDEPLFLLRARDHHALTVLGSYYYHASKDCNDLHLAGIRQVIAKFEKFAAEHPERMKQPGITRHLKLDAASPATAHQPARKEEEGEK